MIMLLIRNVVSVRLLDRTHFGFMTYRHYLCLDFSIAPKELHAIVEAYVASNDVAGWPSLGPVVSALKNSPELRWANPLDVKNAVDKAFTAKFGPKESAKSKAKVSRYFSSLASHSRSNDVSSGIETCN